LKIKVSPLPGFESQSIDRAAVGIAKLQNLEKLDLRWNHSLSIPDWITKLEARGCTVYNMK